MSNSQNPVIMEDKKLTEKESIEVITSMIARTKKHFTKGEGNMLLFWGYLCVIVAVIQVGCSYISYGMGVEIPFSSQIVWWLIPIIGIPYTLVVKSRKCKLRNVMTYTDRLSITLWNYVLWIALVIMIVGAVFFLSGFNVWYVMMLFSFFMVGMAVSVQGMVIKEKSMIIGGAFSVLSGAFLVSGIIIGASWLMAFTVPLYIISFILMMIIPGHILNHKAKQE